ncbi:MAG: RluA family pseudouridine synthase [Magnetococcales bacterium]|nr:RluA family pseudouridine synthase [Magnetococcales bacterium]
MSVRRLLVGADEEGMRLDRYLAARNPGAPGALIQRWLRTGQTRVNGGRARGGYRLVAGEEVRLPPFQPVAREEGGVMVPEWAMRGVEELVLWRDEQVLVLNKPHGLPVHGGSGQSFGSVDVVRALLAREGRGVVGELCHRLDKETSGCLLFALDKSAARRLTGAFRLGQVDKEYLALVRGTPRPASGVIEQALVKGSVRGGGERMVVTSAAGGQSARTRYRVVESYGPFSLVAAMPETGRTHQIRVHLQSLGHPVAGDDKYGDFPMNRSLRPLGLTRMFLHARRIRFTHPATGEILEVQAPLDAVLTGVLQRLGEGSFSLKGSRP